MSEVKKLSLVAAVKDYFGMKPDQTSMDFLKEWKELTDADKQFFREHLPKLGYEITS